MIARRERAARRAGWPAAAGGALLAVLAPRTAWAHPGRLAAPHEIWHHWHAGPAELLLVTLSALWYAAGTHALWRRAGRGHGVTVPRATAYGAGIATLALALFSPLDAMSGALFSAHMVQHLLLMLVAAPLVVCGAPPLPLLLALPATARVRAGRWWMRRRTLRAVVHGVTSPGVAFVLQMLALWFWHFPGPYQAALADARLHALEHLSFFGTASLFWWTVLAPTGRRRASEGLAILLVGATLMQGGVLGAMLMFARAPWYPAHGAGARLWGTTLLADQQLAGLLMWIPAGAIHVAAAAWLFLRWMHRDEGSQDAGPRSAPLHLR